MLSKYFEMKTASEGFKKNIENILRELSGKKILIYGAGAGFKALDSDYNIIQNLNIIAIADKKYEKEEKVFYRNIKTIAPQEIFNEEFDYILVSNENVTPIANFLTGELNIPAQKVGDFDTELCQEFWIAFARDAGVTLHVQQLAGSNSHHIIEGAFKSVARSMKTAVAIDAAFADEVPSTKGMLA